MEKPFGALDHVRDERAHEAVEGLRVAAVVRALDDDVVALALDDHDLGEAAGELALRALDRHGGGVDRNVDAGRNGDGLFADTRHSYLPPFPTRLSDDFAADAVFACVAVGHYAQAR